MTYLRSAIFQVVFYLSFIVQMIVFTPVYFLLPRKTAYQIPKNWARSNLWLARHILGLTFEIEGELWGQPMPLQLYWKTEIDLESGQVKVEEASRTREH